MTDFNGSLSELNEMWEQLVDFSEKPGQRFQVDSGLVIEFYPDILTAVFV